MRWRFGNTDVHDENEVLVTAFSARRLYNPRGLVDRIIKTAVIEGEVLAEGQAAIELRRDAIDTAYSQEQTDAKLLTDSGATTYEMHFPRVLDFVWLQEEHKAHFATALPFRAVIESEEIAGSGLLSFGETITKIGNGADRVVWPELDNGPSIPQIVSNHTNVTLIQSGEAVGVGGWPIGNNPIFPDNLDNPSDTTSRTATLSDTRTVFTVRWNYVMIFNQDLPLPFPIAR